MEEKKVTISRIKIDELFGYLNHDIEFKVIDRITILHGPNGVGKTTVLRLVYELFKKNFFAVSQIPFSILEVHLTNSKVIIIDKKDKKIFLKKGKKILKEKEILKFNFDQIRRRFPASLIERTIDNLERYSHDEWIDRETRRILKFEDIVISYGDLLPREFIEEFNQDLPKEFEEIFSSINIYLIETQRLIEDIRRPSINNRINRPNVRQKTMVENYSEDIIDQIQSRLRESGSLSASLDRKFPGKLLSTIKIPDEATESQIRILYKEQSEFRTRLMNSGLIEQEESVSLPSGKLDGPEIKVLWLYLNDVDTKLAVFNNLLKKTELLMKIINSRFTYKKFKIDKEKGFIFFSEKTKTEIKPNSLSSGEQHELVLAYSLIFKVSENSVVFIDEPELSLHINWQNKFLDDIDEISKITNLDFVIATHSPAIINKRRNLMVGIPTTVG
jgi:predicted ATP-binding protein involved in virulence